MRIVVPGRADRHAWPPKPLEASGPAPSSSPRLVARSASRASRKAPGRFTRFVNSRAQSGVLAALVDAAREQGSTAPRSEPSDSRPSDVRAFESSTKATRRAPDELEAMRQYRRNRRIAMHRGRRDSRRESRGRRRHHVLEVGMPRGADCAMRTTSALSASSGPREPHDDRACAGRTVFDGRRSRTR